MIIGVLCWFSAGTGQAQGTVISEVKVSSVLDGALDQKGSLHDKWVLTRSSKPEPFKKKQSRFCSSPTP